MIGYNRTSKSIGGYLTRLPRAYSITDTTLSQQNAPTANDSSILDREFMAIGAVAFQFSVTLLMKLFPFLSQVIGFPSLVLSHSIIFLPLKLSAGAANAISQSVFGFLKNGICFVKLMTMDAMRFSCIHRGNANTSQCIGFRSNRLQMFRVDAMANSTKMVYDKPFLYFALMNFIREAMSIMDRLIAKDSISSSSFPGINWSRPKPASGSFVDVLKKSFNYRIIHPVRSCTCILWRGQAWL